MAGYMAPTDNFNFIPWCLQSFVAKVMVLTGNITGLYVLLQVQEEFMINPLLVQFKSLLPGQEGWVFFSPQQQTNIPT
jgi:hypothetical protein